MVPNIHGVCMYGTDEIGYDGRLLIHTGMTIAICTVPWSGDVVRVV